ncbi:hypothetical protein C0995_013666 [Termitomyces sp. Mi166|nr:hypothetical protein C0995_013666 [Termitomyces sp. Mi166\
MPAILSPRPARATASLAPAADFLPQPKPRRAPVSLCSTPAPSPAVATHSQRSPCTRRRPKPYSTRRRTSHRPTRPTEPIPIHPFDQLPWIAALDATPSGLWDIADLSQIPDSSVRRPKMQVMTRRAPPDLIQTPPRANSPSPPCDIPALSRAVTSRPTTPLSRFIPSRVLFHNLMPVLCESSNDDLGHDPCTSSPLQPSFFHLLSPRLN